MKETKKETIELTAQEAIEVVESEEFAAEGEREIVGVIFDQDEALEFLRWLTDPNRRNS